MVDYTLIQVFFKGHSNDAFLDLGSRNLIRLEKILNILEVVDKF